jgi:hypothetical protein
VTCGSVELGDDQSSRWWCTRAALRVEGVAAQMAKPRPGRHAQLGAASRAR